VSSNRRTSSNSTWLPADVYFGKYNLPVGRLAAWTLSSAASQYCLAPHSTLTRETIEMTCIVGGCSASHSLESWRYLLLLEKHSEKQSLLRPIMIARRDTRLGPLLERKCQFDR
jgi:hypothetical protein